MKKLMNFLFGRMFTVGLLILLQLVILVGFIWFISEDYVYVYAANVILSLIIVIWLVSDNSNPSTKLPWVIIILLLPVLGGLLYLLFGSKIVSARLKKDFNRLVQETNSFYPQNQEMLDEIAKQDRHIGSQVAFIQKVGAMPAYDNTTTQYLPTGEAFFEKLKTELKKAKRFIFMEFFIVEEGKMWDEILEILTEKVNQGVEVRFMYDDVGCVNTLPRKYDKKLEILGIKCAVFNPFRPTLSVSLQNRDHRKIAIIDGQVGLTGGINLADEYINEKLRFGHWKDAAVILKGEGVWSLTIMFLQSWNYYKPTDKTFDGYRYIEPEENPLVGFAGVKGQQGYVQPYGDMPFDEELVSESVYINMINNATQYIYINTPYLIVDNEVINALILATKKGVDVRICTPHMPDKWYVHLITQGFYPNLIKNGIKIFEYTPGFIHAKTFVSDDETAIVGTINLDYRSLYHHFECGVFMYKAAAVMQVKADYLENLKVCQEITEEFDRQISLPKRMIRGIIRIFAPLM